MRLSRTALGVLLLLASSSGWSWGNKGHQVVALIARHYLTPAIRAQVDAILATDADTLTAPDMASRATWADAWRGGGHRETATWHFVDLELDGPDLRTACSGFPAPADPASAGPSQDCIVDKIREFTAELSSATTSPAERLLALKFLLHFVGDVHQPLHASDNQDHGGNCVLVSLGGSRTVNLHSWWDTAVIDELGTQPQAIADALLAEITPQHLRAWSGGDAAAWAQETYAVARSTAYQIGSPAGCPHDPSPIALPSGYDAAAQQATRVQLERAGVRLAMVLNHALSGAPPSHAAH